MKKLLLLVAWMTYATPTMKAQNEHITDQTDDSTLTANSFSQIDTSHWLKTGILYDKMDPSIPLPIYDGSTSCPIFSNHDFKQLWFNLRTGYTDSTAFLNYDSLFNICEANGEFYNAIPIAAYGLEYETFLPYSIDSGLVQLNNGELILNPTLSKSPFVKKIFWNLGIGFNKCLTNDTISFVLPQTMYFTNLKGNQKVKSLSIDLDDGKGFVPLGFDQSIKTYYTQAGDKTLILRFTDNKGSYFYAKTSIIVANKNSSCYPIPSRAPWADELLPVEDPNTHITHYQEVKYLMNATKSYLGSYARGKVYVKYRPSVDVNNPKFKKPLIFVEGLDFGDFLTLNTNQYNNLNESIKLGEAGWPTLWGCDPDYKLQAATPLLEELNQKGYDIIMLDFYKGSDYIQRNAFLLEELINRVNQHKIGNEQIVVIGASMGGQVARYALTDMESQGIDHCVRLFCSFDSPWNGANVPLSIQAFLHYFANDANNKAADEKLKQLRRPAPRQLLMYHIDKIMYNYSSTTAKNQMITVNINLPTQGYAPADLYNTYQTEIENLGHHPRKCRNISIVNGNNLGQDEYPDGSQYIHYNTNCIGISQKANLFSCKKTNTLIADLNTGTLLNNVWAKKFYVNNFKGVDNCAGSKRFEIDKIRDQISQGAFSSSYTACVHNPLKVTSYFSFIPSTSALGINGNLNTPIFTNRDFSYSPTNTTFFEAFYSYATSTEHIETNFENMAWLKRQILLGEDVLNNQVGPLTTNWNNPLENKHLSGVEIGSGGHLYLNGHKPHYDEKLQPNNVNVPINEGLSLVYLGTSCSSNKQVVINSGGIFELGESYIFNGNPKLNKAELTLLDGSEIIINGGELRLNRDSKIIVKNGAVLRVNENSLIDLVDKAQIVVEDGGEFIVEKNTTINLGHYESIIQFEGKVSLLEDAVLSFEGDGKFVFNQEIGEFDVYHQWIQPFDKYWFFGPNSKIELEGSSSNDIVLEVLRDMHPKMEDLTKPSSFKITHGKVVIAEDVKLQLGSPTNFFNATIDAKEPSKPHGGVHFWGQPSIILKNSSFYNGEVGAYFNNISSPYTPFISQCNFENNQTGISSIGKGLNVSGCTFKFNEYGIGEDNTSISSVISECLFDQNTTGLSVTGQTGFNLHVHDCEFIDNSLKGVFVRTVEGCNISCSKFESNKIGVEATLSIVDISDHSNNVFQDNEIGILFHGNNPNLCGLFLKDGFNSFDLGTYPQGNYIKGIVANGLPLSSYFGADINANNNVMPLITLPPEPNGLCCGQVMPVDIIYSNGNLGQSWSQIQLHIPNNLTSISGGCNSGIGVDLGPYELNDVGNFSGRILYHNEYYPSGLTMNEIVIDAGLDLSTSPDNVLNDEYSFYLLKSMLEANIPNITSDEKEILRLGYSLIKKSYSNLQRYNEEVINYTSPSQDLFLDFIQTYAQQKIQELPKNNLTTAEYQKKFQYSLDKAQLYRTGDYYPEALAQLQQTASFSTGVEFLRSQYWTCVCSSEYDYEQNVINPEEFSYNLNQCKLQFPTASYKNAGNSTGNGSLNGYVVKHPNRSLSILNLYPNPTNKGFTLTLSNSNLSSITITLHDVLGVEVYREVMIPHDGVIQVDNLVLTPGAYLVKLHNDAGEIEHEVTTLMVQ